MAETSELGAFLRARRARVRPADVGLPAGVGMRRTPGLRREELAALAGVSIDYYTRVEQGKETNPSSGVLEALAGALLLDQDAHAHLYALANQAAHRAPPAEPRGRSVRPEIKMLLETLRPSPAYVLSPTSDLLATNPEALLLFDGLADWPSERRNTIRYVFLHSAARELFADWRHAATTGVANLRVALARAGSDASDITALVKELGAESREFARLWERYDVHPRSSEPKTFHHPAVGTLSLQHEVLHLSDEGQRLSIYQAPPDTPDYQALTLLSLAARAQSREDGAPAPRSSQ